MIKSDKKHSELLVLHEQLIQDFRFTKNQIWNTSYLTIIAIAGLIVTAFYLRQIDLLSISSFRGTLIVLIISIGIIGLMAVVFHQLTLNRYRCTLNCKKYKRYFHFKRFFLLVPVEDPLSKAFFVILHPLIIFGTLLFGVYLVCNLWCFNGLNFYYWKDTIGFE